MRENVASLIPEGGSTLEIGPWFRPITAGENASYFDVLDKEQLKQRAREIGWDDSAVPYVDFVSPTGDMSIINKQFDACISSHNIEHQPDLIRHLREVHRILKDDGLFILIIPDKRYCFDHFLPESTVAGIIDAIGRTRHTLKSVIEHRALITHNESWRHWIGDHGAINLTNENVAAAVAEYESADGAYIDVHCWQFTPISFRRNMTILRDLGYVQFDIVEVQETPFNSIEFMATLRKAPTPN